MFEVEEVNFGFVFQASGETEAQSDSVTYLRSHS